MNDAKRQVRSEMRRVRASIIDREARAVQICASTVELLETLRPTGVTGLHVLAFVGVGTEPGTTELIERLAQRGAVVYLPRVMGQDIEAVGLDGDIAMEPGPFGIPAPTGSPVSPEVLDVVILPGLAFTVDGRRLGQGGGYYDRYLPLLRADCVIVGVCFREQLLDSVPDEPHDQKVDRVVTDDVRP